MGIIRYELMVANMVEPDGNWVRHADVEALEARAEEAERGWNEASADRHRLLLEVKALDYCVTELKAGNETLAYHLNSRGEHLAYLRADAEVLVARVARLEEAQEFTETALRSAYDFLLRECAEPNPEKGIVVDEGALPTWNLVCDALAATENGDEHDAD